MAKEESAVTVRPVATARERQAFIRLPGRLAADDPAWVEPLHLERRQFLSPRHNPVFEHAEVALWLAWRGGRPVGRISAQIDSLAPPVDGRKLGYFGMIDAREDDVLAALFATAEAWLAARGGALVRGPFSLSINQATGLLVEGFERPPALLMDHHAPWLGPAVERHGYARAKDMMAYRVDITHGLPERLRRMAERGGPGFSIRSLSRRHLGQEIAAITRLYNAAWAGNWGFVPFTEAEAAAMARDLRPILIPDLVRIAELDGRMVGFIVMLPDLNEALAGLGGRLLPFGWARLLWRLKVRGLSSARVALLGVDPEVAASPLGKLLPLRLIYSVEVQARLRGLYQIEMSWLLEDNWPMRRLVETIGSHVEKVYRVYEKRL